jgi:hypothetical protein
LGMGVELRVHGLESLAHKDFQENDVLFQMN